MHRVDTVGATVDKKFQPENPALGIQATELGADWHNALQEEVAAVIEAAGLVLDKNNNSQLLQAIQSIGPIGAPVTLAVETTLATVHGLIFANPAEGATLPFHLPVYAGVSALKRWRLKNIGDGILEVDALDGKLIDNELIMTLAPGDRCELAKDGVNWQTV